MSNGLKLRGFFRVHIEDGPTGEIVGDSGWVENLITDNGKQDYLCALLGNTSGSKQQSHTNPYYILSQGQFPLLRRSGSG